MIASTDHTTQLSSRDAFSHARVIVARAATTGRVARLAMEKVSIASYPVAAAFAMRGPLDFIFAYSDLHTREPEIAYGTGCISTPAREHTRSTSADGSRVGWMSSAEARRPRSAA